MSFDEEFGLDDLTKDATDRQTKFTKTKTDVDDELDKLTSVSGYDHIIGNRVAQLQQATTELGKGLTKINTGINIMRSLKGKPKKKKDTLLNMYPLAGMGKHAFLVRVADRVDEVVDTYETVMADPNLTDDQKNAIIRVYINELKPSEDL